MRWPRGSACEVPSAGATLYMWCALLCYPAYMLLGTLLSLVVCATLQEFADCLTVNGDATKCGDLREDYFECLHHSKEVRGAL